MFNIISTKISTKNLYLIGIAFIEETRYESPLIWTNTIDISNMRYTLAKKTHSNKYKDIFTGTEYDAEGCTAGDDTVYLAHAIITNKRYITYDEAVTILKGINPTYLSDESVRSKKKNKKKNKKKK